MNKCCIEDFKCRNIFGTFIWEDWPVNRFTTSPGRMKMHQLIGYCNASWPSSQCRNTMLVKSKLFGTFWVTYGGIWVGEKKETWFCPVTKTAIPTANSKTNEQHKNAAKNFDYTTIADRLGTVSWSNNSHPTVVVKPVYEYPTFPLTAKAV